MKFKIVLPYFIAFFLLTSCARRASPTGGEKDENAPVLISTIPAFKSVNFDKKVIKIYFDEYIKLKDINKQLVVSPPLKYPAIITPLGVPSKKIKITLKDTLLENTTYTFNFGESIIDNSEGNILSDFKYIFSTGSFIDSLSVQGHIVDAFNLKPDKYVSILLYPVDGKFNDSTVFKRKPLYVANSLDSIAWKVPNIKKGSYHIVALKDENNDFIYQPKAEKIGFLDSIITIPTDQEILLKLFKETSVFKAKNPKEVSKGHIIFGFEGDATDFKINPKNKELRYKSYLDAKKDTIHFFYNDTKIKDSLQFELKNKNFTTFNTVKLRASKRDTLTVSSNVRSVLHYNDTITLSTNNPIFKVDESLIKIVDKDTVSVSFRTSTRYNRLKIIFDKKESQQYKLHLYPKAITDYFNQTLDTIKYNFSTKKTDYYGSITIDLMAEDNQDTILQLLDSKSEIITEKIAKQNGKIEFSFLKPGTYSIRAIVDMNKNGKWDTGNYLKKIQPERIIYFNKSLDVKENWFVNETFNLK